MVTNCVLKTYASKFAYVSISSCFHFSFFVFGKFVVLIFAIWWTDTMYLMSMTMYNGNRDEYGK